MHVEEEAKKAVAEALQAQHEAAEALHEKLPEAREAVRQAALKLLSTREERERDLAEQQRRHREALREIFGGNP